MNTNEVRTLLREAAGLDRWLGATDPESGQMMVAGWSAMLEQVPLDFARRAVRDHYAAPDARSIAPGDVLTQWRAQQARERQQAADTQRALDVQQALDGAASPVFGSGSVYLADMVAAVARGEDPATITRPAGVRVLTLSPAAQARERQCRFPDICVCTHLECRDGWLDEEESYVDALGKPRTRVVRCPQCDDGLQMAETKGVARKPRRTHGGR